MEFKTIDIKVFIERYKDGVRNILRTRMIKSLEGEVLIVSNNGDILKKELFDCCDFKEVLDKGEILYLPFVAGFDGLVRTVSGEEFDIDEGIEPDWIEGVGYIPMGERIIDIGDFTPSYNNLAGFTLRKKENDFKIYYGEYIKNESKIRYIDNAGLLGEIIKEFIENK